MEQDALAQILSDTLNRFSLDLVKLVYRYLVFGTATADAKPEKIRTILPGGPLSESICFQQIACNPLNGHVWVSFQLSWGTTEYGIRIFDSNGRIVNSISLNQVGGMSFFCNGQALVTVVSSNSISVLESDGKRVCSFLQVPENTRRSAHLRGISMDEKEGLVFSTESSHHVHVFSTNGAYKRTLTLSRLEMFHCFVGPIAIKTNTQELAVAEIWNSCIRIIDYQGNHLRQFGRRGRGKGEINGEIRGLAVDHIGNWIVGDNSCVQILTRTGEFLTYFGDKTVFNFISDVCADSRGLIYVCDQKCVQVFGFTKGGFTKGAKPLLNPPV